MVRVFGIEGLAGDAAQFSQGGDGRHGWRRLAPDFSDKVLETGRTGVGLDGMIEVVNEAADAMVEPGQGEEGGTPIN